MTHPAALAALGFCIGLVGAAVGVGGGFFIVPFLILVAHFTNLSAVATSLMVVFATGLTATLTYARQKRIEYTTGLVFAAATLPGAIAGAWVAPRVASGLFTELFAGLLALASVMLFTLPRNESDRKRTIKTGWLILQRNYTSLDGAAVPYCIDLRIGILASLAIGFASSFFGVGGGLLHVPFMALALGIPFRVAAPTSQFIIPFTAAAGIVALRKNGIAFDLIGLWLGAGAVVGSLAGAWASAKAPGRVLRPVLALILLLVAARLVLHAFQIF